MLKYCNLETFPHKIHFFPVDILYNALYYRYGSLKILLMEKFGYVQTTKHMMYPLTIAQQYVHVRIIILKVKNAEI